MQAVFERAAAVMLAAGVGSYTFGLLLTAFDGTVIDLRACQMVCVTRSSLDEE